jgi:hypothetical protein
MENEADEAKRLRSAALQNASAILQARQRAEQELLEAKEALERKSNELAQSLAMVRVAVDGFAGARANPNGNQRNLAMRSLRRMYSERRLSQGDAAKQKMESKGFIGRVFGRARKTWAKNLPCDGMSCFVSFPTSNSPLEKTSL